MRTLFATCTFCCLMSLGVAASAEFIAPQFVQVSTPAYRPSPNDFAPELGHYEYDVSWQGIPAATLAVDVDRDNGDYRVTATAKTAKAIDLFYKLRYRAEGLLNGQNYRPRKTIIDQRENSKVVNTQISFLPSGEIHSTRSRKGRDTEVYNFDPKNMTLEPFSAAFVARGLPWELGQTREFDTFNGKTRYLIQLTAEDLVTMKVNGEERKVWVISPTVKNLSSPNSEKKLRRAWIYLTADRSREILMIKSEVFVGNVFTELVAFEPKHEPTAMARLGKLPVRLEF